MTNQNELVSAAGATDADARLLSAIRQQLDHSCAALDGHTLSRLHRIRSAAIEQRSGSSRKLWLSFGGLATALLLVLAVGVTQLHGKRGSNGNFEAVDNIEIIASDESIDLYENYEFYQWLAQD